MFVNVLFIPRLMSFVFILKILNLNKLLSCSSMDVRLIPFVFGISIYIFGLLYTTRIASLYLHMVFMSSSMMSPIANASFAKTFHA